MMEMWLPSEVTTRMEEMTVDENSSAWPELEAWGGTHLEHLDEVLPILAMYYPQMTDWNDESWQAAVHWFLASLSFLQI
jgi:squalene cyclase